MREKPKNCSDGQGLSSLSLQHTSGARTLTNREGTSAGVWKESRELSGAPTLRIMGGTNYAQFGGQVHGGGTHVRAKADHAGGTHNLFMGSDRLDGRNEPGGAIVGEDSFTRVEAGVRREGKGDVARGAGEEQGPVRPDAPAKTEEDRGRQLGVGVRQHPRQPA